MPQNSNVPNQDVTVPKSNTATQSLSFDDIDKRVQAALGKSLFTYLNEGSAKGVFPGKEEFNDSPNEVVGRSIGRRANIPALGALSGEEEFKDFYKKAVARVIDTPANVAALFVSFSEELSFGQREEKGLVLAPFGGANVPHTIANQFANELLKNCTIDQDGKIHGVGSIKIDDGSKKNKIRVRIDFDNKFVIPPLTATGADGALQKITADSVQTFFNNYFKPDENGYTVLVRKDLKKGEHALSGKGEFRVNSELPAAQGMNIFLDETYSLSKDPKVLARSALTIRHELLHAMFDSHPEYRKKVISTVKNATLEQREASVLFLAGVYDLFDPDLKKRGKELVIDEAWNAFQDSGYYNPQTMKGLSFFIREYSKQKNFIPDFSEFGTIDKLPVSDKAKVLIKELHAKGHSAVPEVEFLRTQGSQLVMYLGDAGAFLKLLKKQAPEQYKKIQQARKIFIDWVDKE